MAPVSDLPRPKVVLLATGGTIAGSADARSPAAYNAGAVSAEALLAAVPESGSIARLAAEQLAAIGSQDMSETVWLALARRIAALDADPEVDAILVTHGTDTLEETALFLDLTHGGETPVILVGAMRPSSATSADGPANLLAALMVAVSPETRGRGVVVVLNDVVHGARDVTKTSTTAVETFQSPNFGPLGRVTPNGVRYFNPPPPRRAPLGLPDALPPVAILHAHAGMDDVLLRAAWTSGARGLVLAGVGDGNGARPVITALAEAAAAGLACVRASRCPAGPVLRNIEVSDDALGLVAAGHLNPAKARVLLQLLLANGITDAPSLQAAFDAVG